MVKYSGVWAVCGVTILTASASAQVLDDAAKFGAREQVLEVRLSPDGKRIAYLQPGGGPSTGLFVQTLGEDTPGKLVLASSGKPERLAGCNWISNTRIACTIYGITKAVYLDPMAMTRLVAVDADGGNVRQLSTADTMESRGVSLYGGSIVDRLPDQAGTVLIERSYVPTERVGSFTGSRLRGIGVDRLDTSSMKFTTVESPKPGVDGFMSDGHGNIRIAAFAQVATDQATGVTNYRYRLQGSRDWRPFVSYDFIKKTGFLPAIIDRDKNRVYGYMKKDDRLALFAMSMDPTPTAELIYARDDVDVGGLATVGPRERVIGVTYSTDKSKVVYFDPEMEKLRNSLSRAIPKQPLVNIIDSTPDERKLLIVAGSDDDPGVYYTLDRDKHDLHILMAVRPALLDQKLATTKPIDYPAGDGKRIPAYLTLPPGKESAKGLPAIVMPHGGPESRDEWGFDFLVQFFAARGYAVIQPQYRGSAGYGANYMAGNAFKSWRLAIGDVIDSGKWLVSQGIADPQKLAIFGWSYGGYAALQSGVVDPGMFKAIVAVAPVTDLDLLLRESYNSYSYNIEKERIGNAGAYKAASPAQNVDRIAVPVLMFHGTNDVNVGYHESVVMNDRLKAAGKPTRLVTYKDLDHQLEDSIARADMLRQADAFLRDTMKL